MTQNILTKFKPSDTGFDVLGLIKYGQWYNFINFATFFITNNNQR